MSLLLGAIADDFTGATDLANTLVRQGMRAVQVIGVPGADTEIGDAEAVIVALKSRTAPVAEAADESLAALRWLQARGAQQFFFKYCSTFDSTARGNIGPVADALLAELGDDFAFVCPAFPTNGRTIYRGHLFVGDQLLSDSPMKDHPLTPMRDSCLTRLMDAQSVHQSALIPLETVRAGTGAIADRVAGLRQQGVTWGVVDAVSDEDLETIGSAAALQKLVTGGSGVALGLPNNFRRAGLLQFSSDPRLPAARGRALVLAGSCSAATRVQVARVVDRWPTRKIDVERIADGHDVVAELTDWTMAQSSNTPVLIYASADPEEVAAVQQRHGVDAAGEMVESVMGGLARHLVGQGFDRLVVAGGETSGAVVSALGINALRIGPEIDPGVPWTESLGSVPLALALKSGNFGGEDFFDRAFTMLA